jgi:hypothetical protein
MRGHEPLGAALITDQQMGTRSFLISTKEAPVDHAKLRGGSLDFDVGARRILAFSWPYSGIGTVSRALRSY